MFPNQSKFDYSIEPLVRREFKLGGVPKSYWRSILAGVLKAISSCSTKLARSEAPDSLCKSKDFFVSSSELWAGSPSIPKPFWSSSVSVKRRTGGLWICCTLSKWSFSESDRSKGNGKTGPLESSWRSLARVRVHEQASLYVYALAWTFWLETLPSRCPQVWPYCLWYSNAGTAGSNSSPLGLECPNQSQILDVNEPSGFESLEAVKNLQDNSNFDDVSASYLVDIREPSPLQDVIPDETNIANSGEASNQSIELARSTRSDRSAQSDGELDRSFKFGGRPKNPSPPSTDRELTLSDIIPPAECARAISEASLRSSEFWISLRVAGSLDSIISQFVCLFIYQLVLNQHLFLGVSFGWDSHVLHRLLVYRGWNKSAVRSAKQNTGMHVQRAWSMTVQPLVNFQRPHNGNTGSMVEQVR